MAGNERSRPQGTINEHSGTLPSFFVIGPPRTGTSWLHDVLSSQASLPNPIKETRFFDLHFSRGLDWYLRYFKDHSDKRRGEVAPTYFADPDAHKRIAKTVPDARVVCIFRHPVERAVSLYNLKRAYGMCPWSFEEALLRDPELVESGKYATHLKKWQRTLGSQNVLVTFYGDLRDEPQAYLDRVADFIRIPSFRISNAQRRIVHTSEDLTQPRYFRCTQIAVAFAQWLKEFHFDRVAAGFGRSRIRKLFLAGGKPFNRISLELSQLVLDLFRKEVEELEAMLNRDLSEWKSINHDWLSRAATVCAIQEPNKSPGKQLRGFNEAGVGR